MPGHMGLMTMKAFLLRLEPDILLEKIMSNTTPKKLSDLVILSELMCQHVYSTNGEDYYGSDDPHEDVKACLDSDNDAGTKTTYWTGDLVHPLCKMSLTKYPDRIGDDILENIIENGYDEIGGEEPCLDMTGDDKKRLGELVINYIRATAKVIYFGITNEQKHTYITGSNDKRE